MVKQERSFDIPALVAKQKNITEEAQTRFSRLSVEQLNWKPAPDTWSIGQCFDHLIKTSTPYFAEIENIIDGKKTNTVWQKLPVLPKFFGGFIINGVDPESIKKLKAPTPFRPSSSAIEAGVIERFTEAQQTLISLMERTKILDVEKIIVTSPVARFVTYSLSDGYTILVLHNRRHLNQAVRISEHAAFPASASAALGGSAVAG